MPWAWILSSSMKNNFVYIVYLCKDFSKILIDKTNMRAYTQYLYR